MSLELSPGHPLYALVIWSMLLVVIGLGVKLLLDRRLGLRSKTWRPTDALLKTVVIDHRVDEDRYYQYRPKIQYEYRIGAKTYSSRRFSYRSPWTNDYSEASGHFAGLVAGSNFTVYVCPSQPQKSVVLRGADRYIWVEVVVLGVGIGVLIKGLLTHYAM